MSKKKELSNIDTIKNNKITNFHMPRWNEFPDLDIYLDQLVTYIENYLNPYIGSEGNPVITKTMINNYVKQHVIPAPVKKKYSKEHIAYLFVICTLKQVYSISNISNLISFAGNISAFGIASGSELARVNRYKASEDLVQMYSKEQDRGTDLRSTFFMYVNQTDPTSKRYIQKQTTSSLTTASSEFLLRLPEVLLNKAEALAMLGRDVEAMAVLEDFPTWFRKSAMPG